METHVDGGRASDEEARSLEDTLLMADKSLESLLHLFLQVNGGRSGSPAAIIDHRCPSSFTLAVRYRSSSGDQSFRRSLARGLRMSLYRFAH